MTDHCPLCMGDRAPPFHEDARRGYLRCERCALVFVPARFRLSRDEERDIYLRASLVVNLHQDSGREGAPDFINPRTFVLAALGVPQLLEDRLELAPLFDLTNELTVFRPATDLSALVREHLQNPEKREKQAQRAKERALSEHLLQLSYC